MEFPTETAPLTDERYCANPECGIPLEFHRVLIEPGVYMCQRCFRNRRRTIYIDERLASPWQR
ncbi:gp25 [Mycobacterium phage Barnyard]|uniref:Uncharacterized protein n=1 Tax=Mycobacterium phage Barnyard TaxID=205880 RepID=Q856E7_9CAUD|nr:gp25 [Mycobacterium phage Barnyard]AAN02079.1 hypothetical protein PBI_BARNYARD_25 [Mycobacterium phage Barnyard]